MKSTKIKDLTVNLKIWKDLNFEFFEKQYKNIKTGKRNIKYTPGLIDEFLQSYNPVFFLSTGRCGTKYMANILAESLVFDVYHQASPGLLFHQQSAFEKPKSEITKSVISGARFELIFESFRRNRIFLETNNRLTFFAYAMAELFPNAKFVHLVRHPIDFIVSGIRRQWYSGLEITDTGRIRPFTDHINWESFLPFEKVAWLWNTTNQFIEDFKTENKQRVFTYKSEDLFLKEITIEDLIRNIGENKISKKMRKKFMKPANIQSSGSTKIFLDGHASTEKIKTLTPLYKLYKYRI